MSATLTISAAIAAVEALVKFRAKADDILALNVAADSLPIQLPPAPLNYEESREAMLTFFGTDEGKLALELRGETKDYRIFRADPDAAHPAVRQTYLALYYDFTDTAPKWVGPQNAGRILMSGSGLKLSYYVVESHRQSRNPAVTRVLLATAETLLEFGGANAELFVSSPKTRSILASALEAFLGQGNLDDTSGEMLLKRMLGAAVVAAIENPGAAPENPALSALIGALSDLRQAKGDDFVASIFSKPGFQGLVSSFLLNVAEDPALLGEERFRPVLRAILIDLAENSEAIFDDPKALFGVLEVAVTTAAAELPSLLEKKTGNRPLLAAVLKSVLSEVETRGQQDVLFKSVANGEIVVGLFAAAVGAVARNPEALGKSAKMDKLSAALVSGLAAVLESKKLSEVLSTETLRELATGSLKVLAENSVALGMDSEFTTNLVSGLLEASASAVADGLSVEDLADVLDAALRTANENLALVRVSLPLKGLLEAVGGQLSEKGVRSLLQPESRLDLIHASLEAVSNSPKVWSGFGEADLVQPVVKALLKGLSSDPTGMLTGPAMVDAFQSVIKAAARRGAQLIDQKVDPSELETLLSMGLRKLDRELGKGVDAEKVPAYLEELIDRYLADPVALVSIATVTFKELHEETLKAA
jgi:hypothetical protein